MARTRTLAQLQTEVLQTADMEEVADFLDTTAGTGEVARYINASIQALFDLLIEVQGEEWFLKSDTFSTVAGTSEYSIAVTDDDFYLLRGVDWESGDYKVPMRPYNFLERHDDDISWSTFRTPWGGVPLRYRLFGELDASNPTTGYTHKIRLTPEPDSAETVRLWYIPHPPVLDSASDVFDGFNGWEEFVVVDAAIKLLQKEESDTQPLELRKGRIEQRIRSLAPLHDKGASEVIADCETYD